ncbi:peptidase of plants and bacteria-domain-containing protein [Amylocarpus encephaloides]|uniref:Peptidase of plants and bacteria-domain-containing protein n=1 Tax=Amylocarpus encephaloides TaxID=45428 RepID=A0A9P7YCX8_9HELO|nr:peptidase of plants and bacteria-domain-containing protein [Amylocarpus encephaloides]
MVTSAPASSPLPSLVFMPPKSTLNDAPPAPPKASGDPQPETSASTSHKFTLPKLRLEIRDLNHDGAETFLDSVSASTALQKAVQAVLTLLYGSPKSSTTTVPTTRSVTLILRSMPGVAYTTGTELDDEHKEIHFSLDYINSIATFRKMEEIKGVLTHEMVHCYQYNGFGTCPGGLIEGIADWVRLNANLSPPHWKEEATENWDAGYQHTGYFLQYLERRFGPGLVRRINEKLRIEKYEQKRFWTEMCGRPVEQLWGDYEKTLPKDGGKTEDEECVMVDREDAGTPTPKHS